VTNNMSLAAGQPSTSGQTAQAGRAAHSSTATATPPRVRSTG
jgi:hypothetical protein